MRNRRFKQERDHSRRMYALMAVDPAAWVEQAEALKIAAEPVLRSLRNVINEPTVDVRLEKMAYVRGYMLLMGCAFENLLKAIAAAKGKLSINPNLDLTNVSGHKGGHSLLSIAIDLGLALSDDEKDYLARLEEYVWWGGRYPVPRTQQSLVDSYSSRRLTFKTTDPALSDRLFENLKRMAAR